MNNILERAKQRLETSKKTRISVACSESTKETVSRWQRLLGGASQIEAVDELIIAGAESLKRHEPALLSLDEGAKRSGSK